MKRRGEQTAASGGTRGATNTDKSRNVSARLSGTHRRVSVAVIDGQEAGDGEPLLRKEF